MSFYDIGFNDKKYATQRDGKMVREYSLWKAMLKRCYSDNIPKAYMGCYVSENFKSYSYFYDWCQSQAGFNQAGWQLDKDILFYGNKMYGEETCVFIPREINVLFTGYGCETYTLPMGITYHKRAGKFQASVSVNGKNKYIGLFSDIDGAASAYKNKKKFIVNQLCEKYKGILSDNILSVLMVRIDADSK